MRYLLTIIWSLSLLMNASAWTNPLVLQSEWPLYGIGDPYILKHKGTYYLYCSTRDNYTGIKCWSTRDFITWSDAYTCSTDPVTKSAYAPEVVYSNGTFYMYTSPAGNGHYILTSKSPTGPFVAATDNLGNSIDGSVFINDDGKWYFYHAGSSGIMGANMSSPLNIGTNVNLGACMNNSWTEGPCVFKRNGIYYMIYTGNHVISKGYRIDYAKNAGGPMNTFNPQSSQNPILVNSEGSVVGLGHGSAFVGPDLDSYYFTYHNLAGDFGVGPFRHVNFDRIAWNGDKLLMLGPTVWEQQGMKLADMSDFLDRTEPGETWSILRGGKWIIQNSEVLVQDSMGNSLNPDFMAVKNLSTDSNYTAEFTLSESQRGDVYSGYGIVFGYTDEQNYGIALIHGKTNLLEVKFMVNGNWGSTSYSTLPTGFAHDCWHSMRVEKSGNNYIFLVDGMKKTTTVSSLGGGKIGYLTRGSRASFGYIAFTNQVQGSGIFDIYKPVPGVLEAVHYNTGGEGKGYHDLTDGNSGSKYIRKDNVDMRECPEGGFSITDNNTGEWYTYNINAKTTGYYNVGIRYASSDNESKCRIWLGNNDLSGTIHLPATGGTDNFRTFTFRGLALPKGNQQIRFETVQGNFELYSLEFREADNSVVTRSDPFLSSFLSNWNYTDGTWSVINGKGVSSGYGKRTMGNTSWSDYTVQTDLIYTDNMNGGIIFRVNNPALGGAGKDPQLGTDYYQGYYVTLNENSLVLGKQNYNWTLLSSVPGYYSLNTNYTLRVVAKGSNIKVFIDNMDAPAIDFTDSKPFISGKVGLRSYNANIQFDNFTVTTIAAEDNTGVNNTGETVGLHCFPNPVHNEMRISNTGNYSVLKICSTDGRLIYSSCINEPEIKLNLAYLNQGMYLVHLSGGNNLQSDSNPCTQTLKFIKQ